MGEAYARTDFHAIRYAAKPEGNLNLENRNPGKDRALPVSCFPE
jgi:hypothetical protein